MQPLVAHHTLIVLRKKHVVKGKAGCCATSGQRQNVLDLDVHSGMRMGEHCRTKRVVLSRLEGKTACFIGQVLPHAHALDGCPGSPFLLVILRPTS